MSNNYHQINLVVPLLKINVLSNRKINTIKPKMATDLRPQQISGAITPTIR